MGKSGIGFGGGLESSVPKQQLRISGAKFTAPKHNTSAVPKPIADMLIKIDLDHLGIKDIYIPRKDLMDGVAFGQHFAAFKAGLGSRLVDRLKELDSMKLSPEKYAGEKTRETARNVIYEVAYLIGALDKWLSIEKTDLPDDSNYILRALRDTIARNDKLMKDRKIMKLDLQEYNKLVAIYLIRSFPEVWFKQSQNEANMAANFLIQRINLDSEDRNMRAAISTLIKIRGALKPDDRKRIYSKAVEMVKYMKMTRGGNPSGTYPLLPDFIKLAQAYAPSTRKT